MNTSNITERTESRLVRFLPIQCIQPSPENEKLYRPIRPDDPEILELVASIRSFGVQEPLRVTTDGYIISGHRRHAACLVAGLDRVPCIVDPISRHDPLFLVRLRECNRQRVKGFDEVIRERVLDASSADPEAAYSALQQHRQFRGVVSGPSIVIRGIKTRSAISKAKKAMLDAAIRNIEAQRDYWPLSDRSIHYDMLNDPPLKHSSKPKSRYRNDVDSYKDLCDLLTRARLTGEIPFQAIEDPTRTVSTWPTDRTVGTYITTAFKDFLQGYWRDLQQSQPNHIEIIGEKNTIESSILPVARTYCIPYTIGRGYCSVDPRFKLLERFKASGKEKLVLLIMSDFDPEGQDIAHSFARSMRGDFGVERLVAKKVCLTYQQAIDRNLPQTFDIKKDSSRYQMHAAKYGDRAHELEALPAAERSRLLREAIDSVMDMDIYNNETAAERADAVHLAGLRKLVLPLLDAATMVNNANGSGQEAHS